MEVHVIPYKDDGEHGEHCNCWCKPTLVEDVWIHNAADMREVYEEVTSEGLNGKLWICVVLE